MKLFNLLPWIFAGLLWLWGSLLYEQCLELQAQVELLRQESRGLKEQLTTQANQHILEQADATRLRRRSETQRTEINELEQELATLRTEVAFYRKVMVPASSTGAAILDQVRLEPMLSPGHYRLRLVLMQQARRRVQLEGHIELVVSGSLRQQPARLSWPEVNLGGEQRLQFSFRYFQILEVELLLPAQFRPEGVELELVVERPSSARDEQQLRYDWQQLIAEGAE